MSNNEVYSIGDVPFSWENSPGICKVSHKEHLMCVGHEALKLPPPPCPTKKPKFLVQDLQSPLPPCTFQSPLIRASRKRLEKEDPFLAAYMECTKNVAKSKLSNDDNIGGGHRAWKSISMFSCKHSCGVRDDSSVRIAYIPSLPTQLSRRDIRDSELWTSD
ncbi:hypothetical protein MRB53_012520 [Persea americana]|uniref:Uncharacterized protein n=1 Tax=Persea americana TaxID=3435 RepID=A0ACC2LYH7_PERAE|nr:hypothetical protein MRB53_012520 [Persea americana]